MCSAQGSERLVGPHGDNRLTAVPGHGKKYIVQILPGIAERPAQLKADIVIGRSGSDRFPGEVIQTDQVLHPLGVGMRLGKAGLQSPAFLKLARVQIGFQHIAGLQFPPADDMGVFLKQHTGLRGKDEPLVIGHGTAQRTQTVAVKRSTHSVSVRVKDGSGTVPGLHHGSIVPVQVTPRRCLRGSLPGLGQENHAGERQREPIHIEKFHGIIQHLAVAAAFLHDRKHPAHIFAHDRGAHGFLARFHAVMIAANGIDFTVVQQHSLGMRLAPGREGVGGKAGVDHGHAADIPHILQIVIECTKLRDEHHALVDNRPGGEGTDIGIGILFFKDPAQQIQTAVERFACRGIRWAPDKALPDAGHGAARPGAEKCRVAGHIPPSDDRQLLRSGELFKDPADIPDTDFIFGQEEHADTVISRTAQDKALFRGP